MPSPEPEGDVWPTYCLGRGWTKGEGLLWFWVGWSGKTSQRRWYLSRDLREGRVTSGFCSRAAGRGKNDLLLRWEGSGGAGLGVGWRSLKPPGEWGLSKAAPCGACAPGLPKRREPWALTSHYSLPESAHLVICSFLPHHRKKKQPRTHNDIKDYCENTECTYSYCLFSTLNIWTFRCSPSVLVESVCVSYNCMSLLWASVSTYSRAPIHVLTHHS